MRWFHDFFFIPGLYKVQWSFEKNKVQCSKVPVTYSDFSSYFPLKCVQDQKSCSNPLDGLFCQEQLRPGSSGHDVSFPDLETEHTQPFEQASFYFSSHLTPQAQKCPFGGHLGHPTDDPYLLTENPSEKTERVFQNVSVDAPNPIPNIRTRPLNTSHHHTQFQSGKGKKMLHY